MKTLIGGAIGTVLGIIGLAIWFKPFLQLVAGTVPIMLLLGGCLALYLLLAEKGFFPLIRKVFRPSLPQSTSSAASGPGMTDPSQSGDQVVDAEAKDG